MAGADDPEAIAEEERSEARERMRANRADQRTHVGAVCPHALNWATYVCRPVRPTET